ncbi:MAG: cell wall hydrolase [Holosporales bacterium]|jgi:spore germination cell wall hydrolase CwlJ-like protein|nr:cell wall hydrolase [Holosporales bacterium]
MDRDIEIMAKTIYGEARGEYKLPNGGINSLIAVGNVIINRTKLSKKSAVFECLKPYQFSCWNNGDPNGLAIRNVSPGNIIYGKCFIVAGRLLCGDLEEDVTNGATHYYSARMRSPPFWAINNQPTVQIGNHIFFNLSHKRSAIHKI